MWLVRRRLLLFVAVTSTLGMPAGAPAAPPAPVLAKVELLPIAGAVERAARDSGGGHEAGHAAPEAADKPTRCTREPRLEGLGVGLPISLAPLFGEASGLFGAASLGTPTRGSLFGGVELRDSEDIQHAGGYGWGTMAVVHSIERAVREVRRCHPGSPRLYVGDIAREHGGWLRPHASHQSGLDADLGYFIKGPTTWYQRAAAGNLDAPRTWSLMRALIEGDNVETLFVDVSIQRLLKAHIATLPEDERPEGELFESPVHRDALIRHAWGHATHFHVRFRDPAAVELGRALTKLDPTGRAWSSSSLVRR